jgi:lipopolysaccharide/colanic/teichoic acid biosynthesis glycosyltransferase
VISKNSTSNHNLQMHRPTSHDLQWILLTVVLICMDALVVWGSLFLAYTVRLSGRVLTYGGNPNEILYQALMLISVPIWITLFALTGLYRRDALLGGVTEYQRAFRACTAGVMTLIVLSLVSRELLTISRLWLALSWGLSSILVVLERFLVRRVAYTLRRRGCLTDRVLIVGCNEQGIAIAHQWSGTPTSGMQVVGFVDDFKPIGTSVVNGLKVIGRPTALSELVHKTGAHEVVVVPNAVAWETFEEMIARAGSQNDYTLRLSPGFYELLTTGVAVTNKAFVPLLTINEARIVGLDAVLKIMLDYGLGVPLFVLTAPIMTLAALALKIVRPGKPVLAHFQTIGQRGTAFEMCKFATRIEPSNKTSGSKGPTPTAWAGVSWIERALYSSGLDKLPQLFNILAGQMSLVGPRPRVVDEEAISSAGRNLQTVKPGFIGPWTTSGSCDPKDETQDELYYVRNWTIWMDLHVLVQTILYVLSSCWRARRIAFGKQAGYSTLTSAPQNSRAQASLALSKLSESDGESYGR